jgi:hypothetical protein
MEPNLLNGFLEFCLSFSSLSSTDTLDQSSPRRLAPCRDTLFRIFSRAEIVLARMPGTRTPLQKVHNGSI